MGLQTIDGEEVFVVDLKEVPTLPITWHTEEEKPYALALARAIHLGHISKPGKYGLRVNDGSLVDQPDVLYWDVFRIEEP